MPTPSDVVIADRLSDANQVRILGTTGLTVSWELSRAGQLAFEIPRRDLAEMYGIASPLDLLSRWIHYEHPTAGPWGGVITNISPSDGIVSVGAESWAAALRGVGTRISSGNQYGLVSMLMLQLDRMSYTTGIRSGTVDVGASGDLIVKNEPIDLGQDFYDTYIPSVLDRWNQTKGWRPSLQAAGWNIDPLTRRLSFDSTYGTDKSGSIAIRAGRHITTAQFSDDATDIINTVFVRGKVNYRFRESVRHLSPRGKKTISHVTKIGQKDEQVVGINQPSIDRHGEKGILLNENYPSSRDMQAGATLRAAALTLNTQQVAVETADIDDLWRNIREGDLVTVALGNEGVSGKMVVRIRALNVARGVMVYSGEAILQ